jgi:hypothetical protein
MNKFQINPSVAIGLNVAYAILTGLSIPTLNALGFTASASQILAWAGMIALVLNAVLHGYSSSQPGPLAPPDPLIVRQATAAANAAKAFGFLAAVLAACLMIGGARPAHAEDMRVAAKVGTWTPPIPLPVPLPTPGATTTDIFTAIIAYFSVGLDTAETLSTEIPELQDGNGHDCAVAGQTLMSVLKVHPKLISGHAAEDLEGLRLTIAGIKQLCGVQACQTVFAEADNAIATLGIGITVPGLEAICAKLPTVVMVSPALPVTPAPAPSPSPVPTPSPSPAAN